MRRPVDKERLRAFMRSIAESADVDIRLYRGTTAR
jgi:hypothetical protein